MPDPFKDLEQDIPTSSPPPRRTPVPRAGSGAPSPATRTPASTASTPGNAPWNRTTPLPNPDYNLIFNAMWILARMVRIEHRVRLGV